MVHNEHGVGRYLGLETMALDDGAQEFLTLEYAGGSKLYARGKHAPHLPLQRRR